MILSKSQVINTIQVWSPRYHDRRVLIATWKTGYHNRLVFPRAASMPGDYYISGEKVARYPIKNMKTKAGGTAKMYEVPIDDLEIIEYKEDIAEIHREIVQTANQLFPI